MVTTTIDKKEDKGITVFCRNCGGAFQYFHINGRMRKYCNGCKKSGPKKNTLRSTEGEVNDFLKLPGAGILHYPSGSYVAILGKHMYSSIDMLHSIREVKRI